MCLAGSDEPYPPEQGTFDRRVHDAMKAERLVGSEEPGGWIVAEYDLTAPRAEAGPLPPAVVMEYRWASDSAAHGMPHPDVLAADGWQIVARHPSYPSSVLMRRPA